MESCIPRSSHNFDYIEDPQISTAHQPSQTEQQPDQAQLESDRQSNQQPAKQQQSENHQETLTRNCIENLAAAPLSFPDRVARSGETFTIAWDAAQKPGIPPRATTRLMSLSLSPPPPPPPPAPPAPRAAATSRPKQSTAERQAAAKARRALLQSGASSGCEDAFGQKGVPRTPQDDFDGEFKTHGTHLEIPFMYIAEEEKDRDPKLQSRCQEMLPRLYLGDMLSAYADKRLTRLGIGAILNVTNEVPCRYPDSFVYKHIKLNDVESENIERHFEQVIAFIDEQRQKHGVLVHCKAGISRSSSMILAYLMITQHLNLHDAFWHAKSRRDCIWPNEGFIAQLASLETRLALPRTPGLVPSDEGWRLAPLHSN